MFLNNYDMILKGIEPKNKSIPQMSTIRSITEYMSSALLFFITINKTTKSRFMPKIFTVRGYCPNENNNFEYYYQLMSIVRGHCTQEVKANTRLNINSVI